MKLATQPIDRAHRLETTTRPSSRPKRREKTARQGQKRKRNEKSDLHPIREKRDDGETSAKRRRLKRPTFDSDPESRRDDRVEKKKRKEKKSYNDDEEEEEEEREDDDDDDDDEDTQDDETSDDEGRERGEKETDASPLFYRLPNGRHKLDKAFFAWAERTFGDYCLDFRAGVLTSTQNCSFCASTPPREAPSLPASSASLSSCRCRDPELRRAILDSPYTPESSSKRFKRAEMSVMTIAGGPTSYGYLLTSNKKRTGRRDEVDKTTTPKSERGGVDDRLFVDAENGQDAWLEFFNGQHLPGKQVSFLCAAPETRDFQVACSDESEHCKLRVRIRRDGQDGASREDAGVDSTEVDKDRRSRDATIHIARQYMEKVAKRRDGSQRYGIRRASAHRLRRPHSDSKTRDATTAIARDVANK